MPSFFGNLPRGPGPMRPRIHKASGPPGPRGPRSTNQPSLTAMEAPTEDNSSDGKLT